MKIRFAELAKQEAEYAVDYYNQQRQGLGEEFAQENQVAAQHISDFPGVWPLIFAGVRCCLTKRLPYALVYQLMENEIIIVAVMHLHRDPNYWRSRPL